MGKEPVLVTMLKPQLIDDIREGCYGRLLSVESVSQWCGRLDSKSKKTVLNKVGDSVRSAFTQACLRIEKSAALGFDYSA